MKTVKQILHPAATIIAIMVIGTLTLVPMANAAPLSEIVTDNTSYVVMHEETGDHVALLPSGPERIIDVTAEQVCAADNVRTVTVYRGMGDVTRTECK